MTERHVSQPASQRRTIGILGGMGPAATADFYRRVVAATEAVRDQDHLKTVIVSVPEVPDRTPALLGSGEDPTPVLIEAAQTLERAGADFVVMPCNTASAFIPGMQDALSIPVVSWIDVVAMDLARRYPPQTTVGLLATTGTLQTELYQHALAQVGLSTLLPQEEQQVQVMDIIYAVKAGNDLKVAGEKLAEVGASLAADGAAVLLLACTELSVTFPDGVQDWVVPVEDAAQLMAEYTVLLAGGTLRPSFTAAGAPR